MSINNSNKIGVCNIGIDRYCCSETDQTSSVPQVFNQMNGLFVLFVDLESLADLTLFSN